MIPDRDMDRTGEQRRQYYRIVYPIRERPRLQLGNSCYSVIDLSEKGVKLKLGTREPLVLARDMEALISRAKSAACTLTGDVALLPLSSFYFILRSSDPTGRQGADGHPLSGGFTLRLWDHDYLITRVLENRIAFSDPERGLLTRIPLLQAQVTFSDRETIEIKGRLIRIGEGYAALQLSAGVPCRKIFEEQLRLMKTYAGFA